MNRSAIDIQPRQGPMHAKVVTRAAPYAALVCRQMGVAAVGEHLHGTPDEQYVAMRAAGELDGKRGLALIRAAFDLAFSADHRVELERAGELMRTAISAGLVSAIFDPGAIGAFRAGFAAQPDTSALWCNTGFAADFKSRPLIASHTGDELLPLARGKTAEQSTTLASVTEGSKPTRFARSITYDERDILDDTTRLLAAAMESMGRAARRVRPNLVYATVLANPQLDDGVELFHSSRSNILTGASSALSKTSLSTACARIGNQKENGVLLGLRPAVLIVPPALEGTARELVASMTLPGDALPLKLQVEPRLGSAGFTHPTSGATVAGTDTNWLLAIDSRQGPTIAVDYLGGDELPRVRTTVLTRESWGVQYDCDFTLAATPLSGLGLCWSDGA